jgi:uncharacterized membrane protein
VVIAELTGMAVAAAVGMSDRVHPASRPVNIETMHVIIAKTHPNARTVLYYVNSSLARLRETGAYDAITAKHLEQFWGAATAPSQGSKAGSGQPEASPQPNPNPADAGASQPSAKTREPEVAPQQKPVKPGKKANDGKKAGQP